MFRKLSAEFIGTFGGFRRVAAAPCWRGGAEVGIGFVGVSLAFGLSVLSMAYAVGSISGGHFNPAVTLGLVLAGGRARQTSSSLLDRPVLGGVVGAGVLYIIASALPATCRAALPRTVTIRCRRGLRSPRRPGDGSGADSGVPRGHPRGNQPGGAGRVCADRIGLALTLIHSSPSVTNTSVKPGALAAAAIFAQNGAIGQLWLFWLAAARRGSARRADLALCAGAGRSAGAGGGGDRRLSRCGTQWCPGLAGGETAS